MMDFTRLGILLGLVAALIYAVIRGFRQASFDLGVTILMFLAGFAVPGGGQLIYAGYTGNVSGLPSSWPEYVVVAGIAVIGLSIHYLIQSFRNVWARRATVVDAATEKKGS